MEQCQSMTIIAKSFEYSTQHNFELPNHVWQDVRRIRSVRIRVWGSKREERNGDSWKKGREEDRRKGGRGGEGQGSQKVSAFLCPVVGLQQNLTTAKISPVNREQRIFISFWLFRKKIPFCTGQTLGLRVWARREKIVSIRVGFP